MGTPDLGVELTRAQRDGMSWASMVRRSQAQARLIKQLRREYEELAARHDLAVKVGKELLDEARQTAAETMAQLEAATYERDEREAKYREAAAERAALADKIDSLNDELESEQRVRRRMEDRLKATQGAINAIRGALTTALADM